MVSNKTNVALLLLSLLLIAPVGPAAAQVIVGFKSGATFSRSTMSEKTATLWDRGYLSSLSAGALVQVPLSGQVNFVMEPGYVRKGVTLHWAPKVSPGIILPAFVEPNPTMRADYIELPLLLKASLEVGTLRPFFLAGPAVAYKISEANNLLRTIPGLDPEIPDLFARYDVTLQAGAGVAYPVADEISVFVEGRYSFGLNNVDRVGNAEMKSREWRVGGGVLVQL